MLHDRARASAGMLIALVALLVAGCTAPMAPEDSSALDAPTQTISPRAGTQALAAPPTTGSPVPPPATGDVASAPGAPVVVAFHIDDARALFGAGARAGFTIESMTVARLRAGVALPVGVTLSEGTLSYDGPATAGSPVRLEGVLRASAPGEHVLRAWAEASVAEGSRAAPSVLLGVAGDAGDARFFAPPAPGPTLGISVATDPADHLRAVATIAPNVSGDARLVWVVPSRFGAAAGAHEAPLELEAGRPIVRELTLDEPERWEDGYAALDVYVYPDAALDGRLYRDAVYYWWDSGTLRVDDDRPLS